MFKFRLQRVLDLRAQKEKEKATRLAHAQAEQQRLAQARRDLEAARENSVERAAVKPHTGATVGQLRNLRMVVDRLSSEISHVEQTEREADQAVQRCRDEFTEAFKERRVLDRLRERAEETWKADEQKNEQNTMDSVALTQYVRREDGSAEEA